jgi:hypothetical protein
MGFSQNLKREVKEKAAFRCCRCQNIGVQVHHIESESDGGPDTVDNAAPLCPSCHDYFGANPRKQKEIKHMRDWWYQIVEQMYHKYVTTEQLREIDRKLEEIRQSQSSEVSDLKKVMKSISDKMIEGISTKTADTTASGIINTLTFMSEVTLGEEMAMDRSDVKELHYITPIANVVSIMQHGILSHELSKKLSHESFAMEEIQSKRRNKQIPGTRKLHEYANLYFDAHNPMLSKRRDQNNQICILCVNASVLDLPNVIISDRNATADYARFDTVAAGLAALDKNKIYARYWTNAQNPYEAWENKSIKCAEVLIPDRIEPKYVIGAYVANQTALKTFKQLKIQLTVCIKSDIFF